MSVVRRPIPSPASSFAALAPALALAAPAPVAAPHNPQAREGARRASASEAVAAPSFRRRRSSSRSCASSTATRSTSGATARRSRSCGSCRSTPRRRSAGNPCSTPSKPATVFGEECALWAQEFFAALAQGRQAAAHRRRCSPAGASSATCTGACCATCCCPTAPTIKLLLVELGKSPYFNKYGYRPDLPRGLRRRPGARAQARSSASGTPRRTARRRRARPPRGAPTIGSCRGGTRAPQAIEAFREDRERDPEHHVDAELPDELAAAEKRCAGGAKVEVFGEVWRVFDEENGDLTVLFRSSDDKHAFRARVPAERRAALAQVDFKSLTQEFRQNYARVQGAVTEGERGFEMLLTDPAAWKTAGPEPVFASEASAPAGG